MKHAVITGAADGIGKALAYQFAQQGYHLTCIDIDQERARQLSQNLGATLITADLSSQIDIDQTIQKLIAGTPIDILIHNAGINAVGHAEQIPISDQERVISINLAAPLHLTAPLLKANKIQKNGTIIFISSLSHYVSYPGASAYAASKSGLAAYARSLSIALAPKQIRTLTVYPGPTRTTHAQRYSPDNSRAHKRMPPEELAKKIYRAVQKRKRTLIPGFANRFFATLGLYCPHLTEYLMKKAILNKLTPQIPQ